MGKKFSDLERASSLNNGDLFAVAQIDAQAQTGYKSKSTETSTVAQKLLKGIEFPTDLQTDDKTVLGAINEVNSRTIAYDVVSGPIANFKTSLELPIKSLGIDVNAVQAAGTPTPTSPLPISGWSEIKIPHTRKNLLNLEDWVVNQGVPMIISNGTITLSNSGYQENNNSYTLLKNASYTLSFHFKTIDLTNASASFAVYADGNKIVPEMGGESIGNIKLNSVGYESDVVIKLSGKNNISFGGWAYQGEVEISNIQLELDSTATPYEPYSGDSITVSLGGNYFGGHFTQDKDNHRQMAVTNLKYMLDSSQRWQFNNETSDVYVFALNYAFYDAPIASNFNAISNRFSKSIPSGQSGRMAVTNNSGVIVLYVAIEKALLSSGTAEAFKEWLDINETYVVYELATPIIIDLPDGDPIVTFNGTNNIYADSGDASVEYALTVEEYINKKIAEVQALILNS